MANIKLYATSDKEGNIIVFPEKPRFSKEVEGYIGRYGSFILPKRENRELVKKITSKIDSQTEIIELSLFSSIIKKKDNETTY